MARWPAFIVALLVAVAASCSEAESVSAKEEVAAPQVQYDAEPAKFIAAVNRCGLILATPVVRPGDGRYRFYFDVPTREIIAPRWTDLSSTSKQEYERRGNLIRPKFSTVEAEYDYLARFLVVHEAAHYVTNANNLNLNPYWGEVEANKIAIAYFKGMEPQTYRRYIADIIDWYGITDEQVPRVDRRDPERWFNENYGGEMREYPWFQQEILKQLDREADHPDIDLCKIMNAQRAFVDRNPDARINRSK